MPRTTAAQVKAILTRDYDDTRMPAVDPFIEEASLITDDVEEYAGTLNMILTAVRLRAIETRLAAHAYKMAYDKAFASKSNLGSSTSFQGQTGMFLTATLYGQMAVSLDKSGYLSAIATGESPQAGIATGMWLGKAPSERLTIDEQD